MNDVKYLCEQLLADATPPLRDSAEVLASARRSTARRSAARAGGGVLAVAALTGVALLAVPAATTVIRTPLAVAPAAPPSASPPAPPVVVPYAQAASTHDRKMLAAIQRALPAGYTGTSQYPLATDTTPYPTDPAAPPEGGSAATLAADVSVLVTKDGRVGVVDANIINDGKPVPADVCGATPNCQVIEVNGIPIRVTHEHWTNTAPEIDVIVATRYLRNGNLSVVESRSVPDFQSEKETPPPDAVNKHPKKQTPTSALGEWFLTDQQLAELAASPDMLP